MANTKSGGIGTQLPPIAQTLIPEGEFAIKLAEALKVGRAQNEAEAESHVGFGRYCTKEWMDRRLSRDSRYYRRTTKLYQRGSGFGKLSMNKGEALKELENLAAMQGLAVTADTESQVTESEPPPNGDEYVNPDVIDDYYDDQGPPVVTYYPPPPDYRYLYSWVPYPFWCSGFRFRGFFALNDFHRSCFVNGKRVTVSNHFVDPKTRRVIPINPRTRSIGKSPITMCPRQQKGCFFNPGA